MPTRKENKSMLNTTNLIKAFFNVPLSVLKFALALFNFISWEWKTDEINKLIEYIESLTSNKKY